jgi:hypothetical protein
MKRTNRSEKTGHQEAPYGYDSVWTAALILNTSLQIMKEEGLFAPLCGVRDKENVENFRISNFFPKPITQRSRFFGSKPFLFQTGDLGTFFRYGHGSSKVHIQIERFILQGKKPLKIG